MDTLKEIQRLIGNLQEAAYELDNLNEDCESEMDSAAQELASAIEWLEEAQERHDKTVTRMEVTVKYFVNVAHGQNATVSEIEKQACYYVNSDLLATPDTMYASTLETKVRQEPDTEVS